jgi:hypothetical protein
MYVVGNEHGYVKITLCCKLRVCKSLSSSFPFIFWDYILIQRYMACKTLPIWQGWQRMWIFPASPDNEVI